MPLPHPHVWLDVPSHDVNVSDGVSHGAGCHRHGAAQRRCAQHARHVMDAVDKVVVKPHGLSVCHSPSSLWLEVPIHDANVSDGVYHTALAATDVVPRRA